MNEILQQLVGANYEWITGIVAAITGGAMWRISGYIIKGKLAKKMVETVGQFFTSDLNKEEQNQLASAIKNFTSRKAMRTIGSLLKVLDNVDIEKSKQYMDTAMVLLVGIATTLVNNGAFDSNPELKDKITDIVNTWKPIT